MSGGGGGGGGGGGVTASQYSNINQNHISGTGRGVRGVVIDPFWLQTANNQPHFRKGQSVVFFL